MKLPSSATARKYESSRSSTQHSISAVNDQTQGHYLDEDRYDGFWTAIEELDVPLYIHPGAIPLDQWRVLADVPELIGPTWSWGAETGAHALRLIYTGLFDRHPAARVILGHMGEYLPFMLSRLDPRYPTLDPGRTLEKSRHSTSGRTS